MSIASEISALTEDRTAIQNAITAKGGTISSADGFDDFAAAIGTIPSGGMLQDKTGITPTTSSQTIVPDSGYDGLSSVQINAISPTKAAQTYTPGTTDQTIASGRWLTGAQTIKGDANLVAGNIKKDVSIFGVTGSYEGGGGGGLSGYMNLVEITFANSIGTSQFEFWAIGAYVDGFKKTPDVNELIAIVDVLNANDHIRIGVPVEYWGIQIFPWGSSPDGADYDSSNLTLTGSVTLDRLWDGFVIQVTGDGTVTINGVDFDP